MGKPQRGGTLSAKHALGAIARAASTSAATLPFDDVPVELLQKRELDLRCWSLLFTDATARAIATATRKREEGHVASAMRGFEPGRQVAGYDEDDDDGDVSDAAVARRIARREAFAEQVRKVEEGARARALENAREQVGVRAVLAGGAARLTDDGVSELAAACPAATSLDLSGAALVTDTGLRVVALHCTSLRRLDVSKCAGLRGPGLAALGSRCKRLEVAVLSNCAAATGWALAALVKGCGQTLVSLDVSHCPLLNDVDCEWIAKTCAGLTRLSLASCRQVSDVGVTCIASGCANLESLCLARSELPHRVTDTALLSIAEGCGRSLRELDIKGCSTVTDVGVQWIAQRAGVSLTSLTLRGCDRVGNAGCRALADSCTALAKLDLRGAKRVTDVGVRVLGQALGGTLENLDLSFLHLLSDGADRGFGFEGLVALSQDATHLKGLCLDGCFQVSTRALKALSKARVALRDLSLAGCPRLTTEGLVAIAASHGPTLERLNLAGCGDCVDDAAVAALARASPRLTQLVLRDCERWGKRGGAKAIAEHCPRLEKLDLSGCKSIDDDALACLADATFEPGLRHLLLAHCPKVSDIGLSWLTEGPGSNKLVTLALFKTCCTMTGLKSTRDCFPLSELRRDANFFGFSPKPRWEHRVVIHHHGRRRKAAVKFQASFRAHRARCHAKEVDRRLRCRLAAVRVQSRFRIVATRKIVKQLRIDLARHIAAALVIECVARSAFARRAATRLRRDAARRRAKENANRIQAWWRGVVGRRCVRRLRNRLRARARARTRAAITLQRCIRGALARRAVLRRIQQRVEWRAKQAIAAETVQRLVRVVAARYLAASARKARDVRFELKTLAAARLQRFARRNATNARIAQRRRRREAKHAAATTLQARWRSRRDHLIFYVAAADRRRIRERDAAECIQRARRVCAAYEELRMRRNAACTLYKHNGRAAVVIQTAARGRRARDETKQRKRDAEDLERRIEELRAWAATTIAAEWRGVLGRSKAVAARDAQRARWKEMFDDDSKRVFFYNQLTGEIRWRRPQALLELMKRPVCSNCEYFEAAVECSTCQEFFCYDCWHQVHYGGHRVHHPFRSLYDAYGRRVDYGDGASYDSRWPSEIIQDDVNGILLRISPHREPVEVRGAWQRYRENQEGVGDFYYNPITAEGTYEPPRIFTENSDLSPFQLARARSLGEFYDGESSDIAILQHSTVST